MHTLINYFRCQCKSCILRSDDDRVSQILPVRHDAAARPTANRCAIPRNLACLGKTYEVTEGHRWRAPAIKSQNRRSFRTQEDLVDCHVERPGTRRRIINYGHFVKHSFRFPQESSWLP